MKLKLILLLTTAGMLFTLVFLEKYIAALSYKACDIVEINDIYKNIESDMKQKTVKEVEASYGCKIVRKNDANYSNELYSAIRNSDIVIDYLDGDRLLGKIVFPANSSSFAQLKRKLAVSVGAAFAVAILILYSTAYSIYHKVLWPFQKLKLFAGNISSGNLDIALHMDRNNYFGAFTESFDIMREELKRAKLSEYEANVSKKELVAELSHDIKTPVATIKALCELLEVKVKDEDTIAKLHIIDQKADIIDKLISNLFHATLEELEVLKIEPQEELSTILVPMLLDLNHYGKIHLKNEAPGCLIYCDKLRLNQVIDNVVNNSYKYADTDIDVTFYEREPFIEMEIRDHGSSLLEGDLPLVFEKFFRGDNAASHSGSGLGLYLAKQFMKGMEGAIECSLDDGFVVRLMIKKV